MHHALGHINQVLLGFGLTRLAFGLVFLDLLKFGLELAVHVLKDSDLGLLMANIRRIRLGLLLWLLTDPGLGTLFHLHGYYALHGLLNIVFVEMRWYLRRAKFLQLLIFLPQLLPLHLDQILQLCNLLAVVTLLP